jgi:hypothetical protein
MKWGWVAALLGGALLWPGSGRAQTQDNSVKGASGFSSVDYFDPPNQMQISSRFSGIEGHPLSEDLFLVKQMKLETFDTNGAPRYIIEAPECVYDHTRGLASSAGPLDVRQADGEVELTGVGFLWREDDKFLTVSNQVLTQIKAGPRSKVIP